jgi:hypothetical protein
MPSQVPAVLRRSALHDGAMQIVSAAYSWQPPTPSQVPVCPQEAGPRSRHIPWGSSPPSSTGQHVPRRPVWLQLTHAPWQPMLQQTPSVQNPDAQSAFLLQTAPRGFGPQLPFTHETPATQSTSERQVTTQARVVRSQLNGAQIVAGPGLQRPRPSQTLTSTTAASAHAPALHTVPSTYMRQAPLPSQVPSSPQLDMADAAQSAAARGAPPAGTAVQMPGDPWTLHAMQVPVQAVLQQTPSTQKPLWQSLSQPHVSAIIPALVPPAVQPPGLSADPSRLPVPLFDDPPHPAAATATAKTKAAAAIAASRIMDEL